MFGIKDKLHEVLTVLHSNSIKLINIEEKIDNLPNCDAIDGLYDKLNEILNDECRLEKVNLCLQTLDKFEDYMKNVDKLNIMVNEIKGIASMTRASLKSTDCTKRLKTSKKETST